MGTTRYVIIPLLILAQLHILPLVLKVMHLSIGKAVFGETEWFFFSPRDRKYPNGARPNRAAGSGYWKATGTDKPILSSDGSQCLVVKKALVFYKRVPNCTKTDWVMHEYRLLDDASLQRLRGSTRVSH